MAVSESKIVYRTTYAAVKQRRDSEGYNSYDVWKWNVFKLKWVRMANHASGYGSLSDASDTADVVSFDIKSMLDANRSPPKPIE